MCGVDQGCSLAAYAYAMGTKKATFDILNRIQALDPQAKMLVYLDDGYIWVRKDLLDDVARIIADRFAQDNLEIQPTKLKVWVPDGSSMAQTWENRKVETLDCLGSHLRIAGEEQSSPIVLGEVPEPFAEPERRLQSITANLVDLVNNGGLSKHVATSLLRSYVMSASQHVLRNNFATKQQAAEFDRKVLDSFTQLLGKQVDNSSPCHLPTKNGGVNITIAEDRCHIAIWTAWLSSLPAVMRVLAVRNIDEFIDKCPNIGEQLSVVQKSVSDSTGLRTLGLQPLAISLRNIVPQKKLAERAHNLEFKNMLEASTPPLRAVLRSAAAPSAASFLDVPRDPTYLIPDDRFVTAFFRRLFAPWPGCAATPIVALMCPNKTRQGVVCSAQLDQWGIHSTICQAGGGVVQRHDDVVRALAALIYKITSCKISLEKRSHTLDRQVNGVTQEGQMDIIVADLRGAVTYIDVALVSPVVQDPARITAAANRNAYAAKRMEAIKRARYPGVNLIPFVIELGGRPGPSARKLITDLFEHETQDRESSIAQAWTMLSCVLQNSIARQIMVC